MAYCNLIGQWTIHGEESQELRGLIHTDVKVRNIIPRVRQYGEIYIPFLASVFPLSTSYCPLSHAVKDLLHGQHEYDGLFHE